MSDSDAQVSKEHRMKKIILVAMLGVVLFGIYLTISVLGVSQRVSEMDAKASADEWSIILTEDEFMFEGNVEPPFAKMLIDDKDGIYVFVRDKDMSLSEDIEEEIKKPGSN